MGMSLTQVRAIDDRGTSLQDLISGSDLRQMYQFNFMHDVPWVLMHLTAKDVESHFIYGYKNESEDFAGQLMRQQTSGLDNVHIHGRRLEFPFGTHHSKIMVLKFDDDSYEVVIHTANMIEFDWRNMTQGVWRSARLVPGECTSEFQTDFVRYLKAYRIPAITALAKDLLRYDFSKITDTLVASVPGNYLGDEWGMRQLAKYLHDPVDLVCQVSSIATLPTSFFDDLKKSTKAESVAVVYPTVENIADSLSGYESGGSIHFKRQSASQQAQYNRMRPWFRQWFSEKADRQRAAPHIKTYVGLEPGTIKVKWFLLTSANLSKQAWGVPNKRRGTFWIQSWECGVLRTWAKPQDPAYIGNHEDWALPYDLPTKKYGPADQAWSAWEQYTKPDSLGRQWP